MHVLCMMSNHSQLTVSSGDHIYKEIWLSAIGGSFNKKKSPTSGHVYASVPTLFFCCMQLVACILASNSIENNEHTGNNEQQGMGETHILVVEWQVAERSTDPKAGSIVWVMAELCQTRTLPMAAFPMQFPFIPFPATPFLEPPHTPPVTTAIEVNHQPLHGSGSVLG